jgi:cholesterol transport system auxiliary component
MSLPVPYLRVFLVASLALLPLLGGCGGLIPSPPKRDVYRVSPIVAFASPLPRVTAQLLIAAPIAGGGLDNDRIALSRAAGSLDYFADAQWSDRLPFLIQAAIIEAFEKSRAVPAIGSDSGGLQADYIIDSEIRDFEAVYDSPDGAPRAVVRLQAKLVKMPERRILAQTSIAREEKAAANTIPKIVDAFGVALGGALQELVGWTVSNPALSPRRR